METSEIKTRLYKVIDEIENEQLLLTLYDFLKERKSDSSGSFWKSLTDEQRQEILSAFEETEDEDNLIEKNLVFKRNK